MLNKVPEVTLYFWIIKVLCTTVGETAADFLNTNLNLGLTGTTYVISSVLAAALFFQFRLRRYVPSAYWLAVVLISVVGTLITDNLTDNFGVSLVTTTIVFSVTLAAAFAAWYASERTLSIHSIFTTRREAFYWLAVLVTFALGTAAGDLTAERLAVGYWQSALVFGASIAVVFVAHARFALNAVLAFWIAYILTRPLGASIGDYLSQARADGGLGLGTTVTSVVFLLTILGVVVFLTITKRDRIEDEPARSALEPPTARVLVVTNKTAATGALIAAVRTRAAAGPAEFVMLVPNPAHLAFDRNRPASAEGEQLLARALPPLEQAAGAEIEGRVAVSPNAFDDIVAELGRRKYSEIILETLPSHVSHWLHVDLAQRIAHLGYPLTTVTPTA
ncbi:MAG: hypothetical protein QOF45_2167 [Gaiellaceae bacterium]|nr:hypothetical protein [Gaiellaceae bacterium]